MTAGGIRPAFVEQEGNVNMEHLGSGKQNERKIDQSSGLWRASPTV